LKASSGDCSDLKVKVLTDGIEKFRQREYRLLSELEEERSNAKMQRQQYELRLTEMEQQIKELQLKNKEVEMQKNRSGLEIEELRGIIE
jgi:chaperonin cofactor prefoldin